MRNLMYLRNYASTIRELAERGHSVVLFCETEHGKITEEVRSVADGLFARSERVQIRPMPGRTGLWAPFAQQLRVLRDYARYLDPRLAGSTKCAARAESLLYPPLRDLVKGRDGARAWRRARLVSAAARRVEACLPPAGPSLAALRRERPDAVIVTPLVDFNSDQVDLIKAARALGLPCALAVASWDNLTNKGLIQVLPDRLLVWNEAQRDEAAQLHGVPAGQVMVTGAQLFDHWFERQPSRDRATFCRQVGLDPARPFILYTCSSVFIARQEAGFVARWLERLRSHPDPLLREAGVLIRPHPGSAKYAAQWQVPEIAGRDNVAVFPKAGGYPVVESAQADYYDSLYHAAAVFGINTSALLEAGIVGRPTFTLLAPEFAESQEAMVHFKHLTRDGFLHVADDFEGHLEALRRSLAEGPEQDGRIARFVAGFLRPHGLDRPATPLVAEACESLAQLGPARSRPPLAAPLVRLALLPAALWLYFVGSGRNTKKWGPKNRPLARIKTWVAIQLGWVERSESGRRGA
ncbi:hypothetical protein SAMN06265365_107185 [Tistlia consotensis]|uniref:CDP-Glycerol:Poly(Glycerophosphate) glycerophosphotransferase n=2 Tax=Tistlia TaxID=1321364 RepID=A0A1Y6B9K9_9PROT|nr:hypothetical protein SAMN05428998_102187 [Tistlia consotensis USBA 355]SNR57986.1 hypothetical protein SAMN06265365_107185 [Tistlia consotensis]